MWLLGFRRGGVRAWIALVAVGPVARLRHGGGHKGVHSGGTNGAETGEQGEGEDQAAHGEISPRVTVTLCGTLSNVNDAAKQRRTGDPEATPIEFMVSRESAI